MATLLRYAAVDMDSERTRRAQWRLLNDAMGAASGFDYRPQAQPDFAPPRAANAAAAAREAAAASAPSPKAATVKRRFSCLSKRPSHI